MLEQFLMLFVWLLSVIAILGSIVAGTVFQKINVYLGAVLLIAAISGFITIIDHQVKSAPIQVTIQGDPKC